MNLRPTFIMLMSLACFIACEHDENRPICRPSSMISNDDSVAYIYSGGKLVSLQYILNGSGRMYKQDDIEYDHSGMPVKLTESFFRFDGSTYVRGTYRLIYEDELPSFCYFWHGSEDPMNDSDTITFLHDHYDRLIEAKRSSYFPTYTRTFEYDSDNNVSKSVLHFFNPDQITSITNLEFDNHGRYFSTVKELELINIYMFGHEPGANNKLKAAVKYERPNSVLEDTVVYFLQYNDRGFLQSQSHEGNYVDYVFTNLNYDCN